MNSLEQSDAEEALAEWMESANIENAWKMAPTLVSIGMDAKELECARDEFDGPLLSEALSWLEAMVSSMQLVGTIEESIGRVTDLVHAVKSYAYEGKGQKQTIDINDSIHATHDHPRPQAARKRDRGREELRPRPSAAAQRMHRPQPDLDQPARQRDRRSPAARTHPRAHLGGEEVRRPRRFASRPLHQLQRQRQSAFRSKASPMIFDPFYTTKPVGVGTGIGLGIVQRIVEQYGGVIRFSSEPGNTEFVIRLPSDREPASVDRRAAEEVVVAKRSLSHRLPSTAERGAAPGTISIGLSEVSTSQCFATGTKHRIYAANHPRVQLSQ